MTARSIAPPGERGHLPLSVRADSVSLFDWEFDARDESDVIDHIFSSLHGGVGGWVVTPNVDILRLARKDPDFGSLIRRASLVLVDGAPLQWAGRLSGQPHVTRTPGSSLMAPIAEEAARRGVPLLLFGGRPGAADAAAGLLAGTNDGLDVRTYCPPLGFENDRREWHRSLDAIAESTGGIVMCGLGAPKQEFVMSRLTTEFGDTWFLGVGGSIDMAAGYVQRAPSWMQRGGLEWIWRLGQEPRRLFRRYVIDDLPFAVGLLAWAVRERMAGTFTAGPPAYPAPDPVKALSGRTPWPAALDLPHQDRRGA